MADEEMMRIGVLGWGSLIWDSRGLPRLTRWRSGGPKLKIEFSRISSDGRLTLVIDPQNGVDVPTRYCESARRDLDDGLCDLCSREATVMNRIGFVDLTTGESRCDVDDNAEGAIGDWARTAGFDSVVWTDLPSNFEDRLGVPFSVAQAVDYLQSLPASTADQARNYIRRAPGEVETPLRSVLADSGWLDA